MSRFCTNYQHAARYMRKRSVAAKDSGFSNRPVSVMEGSFFFFSAISTQFRKPWGFPMSKGKVNTIIRNAVSLPFTSSNRNFYLFLTFYIAYFPVGGVDKYLME